MFRLVILSGVNLLRVIHSLYLTAAKRSLPEFLNSQLLFFFRTVLRKGYVTFCDYIPLCPITIATLFLIQKFHFTPDWGFRYMGHYLTELNVALQNTWGAKRPWHIPKLIIKYITWRETMRIEQKCKSGGILEWIKKR